VSYETLQVHHEDGVLLVRLNRPEALNALNSRLLDELSAFLAAADVDAEVRCVVLTGSDKAFAAGADIKEMSTKSYAEMFRSDFFTQHARSIEQFRKPLIAAVAGYALEAVASSPCCVI
jgi:enoyl-CoA hydratase/carnithine racemase